MAEKQRTIENEIFGASDSELSSAEEDIPKKPIPSSEKRARRDEYESSGRDSEDDYVQEKKSKSQQPKKQSQTRKPKRTDRERPAASKKRKRPEITEEDLASMAPEEAAKVRWDMRIQEIIKPAKSSRPKKRKAGEEELDVVGDSEVAKLREAMNAAAEEDLKANSERLPATSKLRLLPEVVETLRKASLAQSITDNNLLEAVKRWLEPLPDKSLPALNIQRELFPLLKKMDFIDSVVLRESGLGRIVLFYSICKRVTPDISRVAVQLVSTWSRPIIKRPASFRERVVPVTQVDEVTPTRENLNSILARAKANEKGRRRTNAVMIPVAERGVYNVAPKSMNRANPSVEIDIERRRMNAERLRSLTRKVANKP